MCWALLCIQISSKVGEIGREKLSPEKRLGRDDGRYMHGPHSHFHEREYNSMSGWP